MQVTKARPEALLGIFAMIVPFGFGVILLSNFGAGTTFATVVVFAIMFLFSVVFATLANRHQHNIKWYDAPETSDLKWIPIGLGIILLGVFVITPAIPGTTGILIGIGFGGAILGFQLYKTQTVFVPWITHAIYNITAVLLASFAVIPLASSPIFVPNFTFDSAIANDLLSQVTLQLIVVSLSEEMMKVSLAIGVALLFRANLALSIGTSVIAWTVLHSVLAYRISLPF